MSNVGDINSNKIGTAARYNSGKPDLSLIPFTIIASDIQSLPRVKELRDSGQINLHGILDSVDEYQFNGGVWNLYDAIKASGSAWEECAHVFTYGTKKYDSWNWLKGMDWSIPVACIGRHVLKMAHGQDIDEESGISHRGHIMCNLVMLIQYTSSYPQGNNLPQHLFEE